MLYLEVLDEFYDDIERSYGDYKDILNNFIHPTNNFYYINELIIKKYLSFGYNKECYDCCKKILYSFENYTVPILYDIYFSVLFSLFVSSFYYKREETKNILNKIKKLIDCNPYIELEYKKNEEFYLSQFSFIS
jgi:hypothetical protein